MVSALFQHNMNLYILNNICPSQGDYVFGCVGLSVCYQHYSEIYEQIVMNFMAESYLGNWKSSRKEILSTVTVFVLILF